MKTVHVVGAVLFAASSLSFAQYPSKGNPDPSWNGGRPKVVAVRESAFTLDRADGIATLSGTRFAVRGYRDAARDYIAIIDTVPERVTVFDTQFAVDSVWESLQVVVPVNDSIVVAGTLMRPDGKQVATLQVIEVGVQALPVNISRGARSSESSNPSRPNLITHTVSALAADSGLIRLWQVRSEFDASFGCGASILHRLDHQSGAFVERAQLNLASELNEVCLVAYHSLPVARRSSDPPGSQAIVVGASCRLVATDVVYVCITRVLDTNGTLAIDRTFGTNGLLTYGKATRENWLLGDVKTDGSGNLIVPIDHATGDAPVQQLAPLVIRVKTDGTIDNSFGSSGRVDIPVGIGGHVGNVAITPAGVIQAVGSAKGATGRWPYIYYYDPGTGSAQVSRLEFTAAEPNYGTAGFESVVSLPGGGALAVGGAGPTESVGHTLIARLAGDRQTIDLLEYYHAAFNHFFVASVPAEIQKLDDGTFVGWQRTGYGFAALPIGTAGASDACRFFSETFTPRSSHFYTTLKSECEGLKGGNVWSYEGVVFALLSPSATGACPSGTNPLFRLFNDGDGGAPNHRFTTSESARAAQAGQGWIGEGSGTPPVFACVPA